MFRSKNISVVKMHGATIKIIEILFHSGHNPVRCTEYSHNVAEESIYCVYEIREKHVNKPSW